MSDLARPARGLVVMRLGPVSLWLAAAAAAIGAEVRYVRTTIDSDVGSRIMRRFSVLPIALENEPFLPPSEQSYASPVWAADRYLRRFALDGLLGTLAAEHPAARGLEASLRVALLRALSVNRQDVYIADTWLRLRGYRRAWILASKAADRRVVRGLEGGPRAPWWPALPARAGRVLGRVRAHITRPGRAAGAIAPQAGKLDPDSPLAVTRVGPVTAIFVSNMENTYGALYRYDYLYSDDPESPLHSTRMALMARPWENFRVGIEGGGYPTLGARGPRMRRAAGLAVMALRRNGLGAPIWMVSFLSRFVATAEAMAAQIHEEFPDAQGAAFGFETQVPAELDAAFDIAGITTFALSERPANAVDHAATFTVRTLQVASTLLAAAAKDSWAIGVQEVEPIGMWRTDLLMEGMSGSAPECIAVARAAGRKPVVALPYHLSHVGDVAQDPIAKSAPSVAHFLLGMLDLADRRDDVHVVIRGKNADWVGDERFAAIVDRIALTENLEVNSDYAVYNEAYRLCGHADLVIAKPTSLAEETLALGIPTLMHDYTHNLVGYSLGPWSHLPRGVWCLDDRELAEKVDWALRADAQEFRDWWEPLRGDVYGNLNDGKVRERARARFLRLVAGTQ